MSKKKVEITSISATLSMDDVTMLIGKKLAAGQGPEVAEIYNMLMGYTAMKYMGDSLFEFTPPNRPDEPVDLKWFIVTRMEVYEQPIQVQAIDEEDAIIQVEQDAGDYCVLEFHHCLDTDMWKVEESGEPAPLVEVKHFRVSFHFQDASPHSETRIIQVYVEAPAPVELNDNDVIAYAVDRKLISDHEAFEEAVDRTVNEITEEEFRSCTCRR